MKTSDLFKINRGAESGQISLAEYEKFHAQAAKDAAEGKHIDNAETAHLNNWLKNETKDFKSENISFVEMHEEQQAHYINDIKSAASEHDKDTRDRLSAIAKAQEQKQENIQKYVDQQKESLAKAIALRDQAKKTYQEKKAKLDDLSKNFNSINKTLQNLTIRIQEKQSLAEALKPKEIESAKNIVNHYSKSDNNFGLDQTKFAHEADYAMAINSQFKDKMQSYSDAAKDARNPDVRERIEIEIARQQSTVAISKNHDIARLTGTDRSEQIKAHEDAEKVAAIRTLELDMKLEANGIKVDFTRKEPQVRAIEDSEKVTQELKGNLQDVRKLQFEESALKSTKSQAVEVGSHLTKADEALQTQATQVTSARANMEATDETVSKKSSLLLRIEKQQADLMIANKGAKISDREQKMLIEARATQKELAQQKNQDLSQGQSQSHAR